MMLRTLVATAAVALALSGCDRPKKERDHKADAAQSVAAQLAVLCPNEGFSWEMFETRAAAIGAKPGEGEVRRAIGVKPAEIKRETWVALDHLGYRTTAWIAELKPGVVYSGLLGLGKGRRYEGGLVCALHDPTLSIADTFALTKGWGDHGEITGADKREDGTLRVRRKTWVNANNKSYYQDIDVFTFDKMTDSGALFTRHRYDFAVSGN